MLQFFGSTKRNTKGSTKGNTNNSLPSINQGFYDVFNENASDKCLFDAHIERFNELVREQTNGQFWPQSPGILLTSINGLPRDEPYVQILFKPPMVNTPESVGHWITMHYKNRKLYIYNSTNSKMLDKAYEPYLKGLFPRGLYEAGIPNPIFPDVQNQTNAYDCGVYAIAFVVSILYDRDPSKERYDRSQMRPHLKRMFETSEITPFPLENSALVHPFPPENKTRENGHRTENGNTSKEKQSGGQKRKNDANPPPTVAKRTKENSSKQDPRNKNIENNEPKPVEKKPRGRPRKGKTEPDENGQFKTAERSFEEKDSQKAKQDNVSSNKNIQNNEPKQVEKKPRGRPRKNRTQPDENGQFKTAEKSFEEKDSLKEKQDDISSKENAAKTKKNEQETFRQPEKRSRGRPAKQKKKQQETEGTVKNPTNQQQKDNSSPTGKRGPRKPSEQTKGEEKNATTDPTNEPQKKNLPPIEQKRRGRPSKERGGERPPSATQKNQNEDHEKREQQGEPTGKRLRSKTASNERNQKEKEKVEPSEKIRRGRPRKQLNEGSESDRSVENRQGKKTNPLTAEEKRETRLQQQREYARRKREKETEDDRNKRLESERNRKRQARKNETNEETSSRLQNMRKHAQKKRQDETEQQTQLRLENERLRAQEARENETEQERQLRLQNDRLRAQEARENESEEEKQARLANEAHKSRERRQNRRRTVREGNRALARMPVTETDVPCHHLGPMNVKCTHCSALHFESEKKSDGQFNSCCHRGKVPPLPAISYPDDLKKLLTGEIQGLDGENSSQISPNNDTINQADSRNFKQHIRSYNSAFSFLSLRANLEAPPNRGPYVFRIHGAMYHSIGPLHPLQGQTEKYAQLYILDTSEALRNRMGEAANVGCTEKIMSKIDAIMRFGNPFAQTFNHMAQIEREMEEHAIANNQQPGEVFMSILKDYGPYDKRRYNEPRADEIAVVFQANDGAPPVNVDFLVHPKNKTPYYINQNSPNLDPMRYPILFPTGQRGWSPDLKQTNGIKKLTALQYYSNRLMVREEFDPVLHAGKLTQEYVVGSWVKVEADRLCYIRNNQSNLRSDLYSGLMDHINNLAETEGLPAGRVVILPSSFSGSPRQVQQNYQDAMSIVRKFGRPDLFITMTCNPKWAEITENLAPDETASDRPDLVARVFWEKLMEFKKDMLEREIFGSVTSWLFVIEFQKRGLPHAHMLYTLQDKITGPDDIDDVVCAEIPDPTESPRLYEAVKSYMIHGPCGQANMSSPCMEKDACSKNYPKHFLDETQENVDGYPQYRRRFNGRVIRILYRDGSIKHTVDNRWIVPYNPYLTLKYNTHVNVEICASIKSIKYLFKYVYKGHDCALINIRNEESLNWDEINQYLDARYVCAPEAMHHLLEKPMHEQSHAIYRLAVHLPNQQTVVFRQGNEENALERNRETTLTAWFTINETDPQAREIYYCDFPQYYVYHKDAKQWRARRALTKPVIGRMYSVSPKDAERFYLRLLLLHKKGATSYEDLRTIEGVAHATFKQAAIAMGLVEDDQEWRLCLADAATTQMPRAMRQLFAFLLVFCNPKDPPVLWNDFKADLCEDYLRKFPAEIAERKALRDIYEIVRKNGDDPTTFGLPVVPPPAEDENDDDLENQNEEDVRAEEDDMSERLNDDQKSIFDQIMTAVLDENAKERLFYMEGPGGTGKTFLYNAIIQRLDALEIPVMAVAWTGIAATLLKGGRTSHSGFKFPFAMNETSTSGATANNMAGKNLRRVKCIIWDEITVAPKDALRCADLVLRDLTRNDQPFGGKVILLGGNFNQCLPVVKHSNRAGIVEACIKRSPLWPLFKKVSLTRNMRVNQNEVEFARWLLEIGAGKQISLAEESITDSRDYVNLPSTNMMSEDLVADVFGDMNSMDFTNKVILCGTNDHALATNETILDKLQGPKKTYLSVDTVVKEDEEMDVPIEFVNSITPSGMPPHELNVKNGSVVMLLRNMNVSQGLCNGTRLIVKRTMTNCLDLEIITGEQRGERVLLPRVILTTEDSDMPFKLSRRQFPLRLSFAMTINKSQGQTFDSVGIDLRRPVFAHGQLYVALSRVRNAESVKIQIGEEDKNDGQIQNVVYQEILEPTHP